MEILQSIKKAYFQQYGNGTQVLKVWYRSGSFEETKKDNYARSYQPEILNFLWTAFNFENGKYVVDNRTEQERYCDYEESMVRNVNLGLSTKTYEEWLKTQEIVF